MLGPELAVTYEARAGAARKIFNRMSFLSSADDGDPLEIALGFVREQRGLLRLSDTDLAGIELGDSVYSSVTDVTHLYLHQRHGDIAVYNGFLQVSVTGDGRVMIVHNASCRISPTR